MAFKVIYFIRHGQTELNARGIRQGPDGPLSEKGRKQAAEVVFKIPQEGDDKPQALISSPFQRARETAEIIGEKLGMKVEFSRLLEERKNPTEIVGHEGLELGVMSIVDRIDKSYHEDNLKFSDEENFVELRARANKLIEFIINRKEESIIMVTHGIYLKMVVTTMLYGNTLKEPDYLKLRYFDTMDNAALTICTVTTHWLKKPEWKLVMWNNETQKE